MGCAFLLLQPLLCLLEEGPLVEQRLLVFCDESFNSFGAIQGWQARPLAFLVGLVSRSILAILVSLVLRVREVQAISQRDVKVVGEAACETTYNNC